MNEREKIITNIYGDSAIHEDIRAFLIDVVTAGADIIILVARRGYAIYKIYLRFIEKYIKQNKINKNIIICQDNALPFLTHDLAGREVLIVDDVAIEGKHLKRIIDRLINVYNADNNKIKVAVFGINEDILDNENHENHKNIIPRRLSKRSYKLDKAGLYKMSGNFSRISFGLSHPFVAYSASFALKGRKKFDFPAMSLWEKVKVDIEPGIGTIYYMRQDNDTPLNMGIRMYYNNKLRKTILIPGIFLPNLNEMLIDLFCAYICENLNITLSFNHMNDDAQNKTEEMYEAKFRLLHYVFGCYALHLFKNDYQDFNIDDIIRECDIRKDAFHKLFIEVTDESYNNLFNDVEFIALLNNNMPGYLNIAEPPLAENLSFKNGIRAVKRYIAKEGQNYDAQPILIEQIQNALNEQGLNINMRQLCWMMQAAFDGGIASVRGGLIRDRFDGGIASVRGGLIRNRYGNIPHASESSYRYYTTLHKDYGEAIFYVAASILRNNNYNDEIREKIREELEQIIKQYLNDKNNKNLFDTDGFKDLIEYKKIADADNITPDMILPKKPAEAMFFTALSMYYEEYAALKYDHLYKSDLFGLLREFNNSWNFKEFLVNLPETSYVLSVKENIK